MYEKDNETLDKLVNEAISRSQKDIRLAHIFIGFANPVGLPDTVKANEKAKEAYALLKANKSFTEVAAMYSDDTASKLKGGDLGYITVFSLVSSIYTASVSFHVCICLVLKSVTRNLCAI